ncbi:condensation domain-containing protein [Nonomuraea sp. NPDC050663]|uniref:condensation domain-containing protein n=1 Tax=Nonomuraea sp. NPDC050663 TaxID=3364370 RepID=UPI0037AECBCD
MSVPASLSREDKRALLAELISAGAAPFPLSHGQQSLWFMDRVRREASVAYNMPFAWTIRGAVDPDALRRAFAWLMARHPILRTTYAYVRGTPVQRVNRPAEPDLVIADPGSPQELADLLAEAAGRPFDLATGPVFRVVLARRPGAPPVLLWVTHHIAIDGWSLFLMLEELGQAYTAYLHGREPDRPAPEAGYADFVAWQAAMLAGPWGDRLADHWSEVLHDPPPPLALPLDRPRPADQGFRGACHAFRLDAELTAKVEELAARHDTTVYTTLLAAFQFLLGRAAGQREFLLGTWTSGRSRPEFAGVAGYFVNPVVLRTDLSGEPGFSQLLSRTRSAVLDALEHQDYPFPLLVERLGTQRDPSRSPLFDVAFTLRASQRGEITRSESGETASPLGAPSEGERGMLLHLGELVLATYPLDQQTVRFDVEMELISSDGELSGLLRYRTDLFDAETIVWLAQGYRSVLEEVTAEPDRPLDTLSWRPRDNAPRAVPPAPAAGIAPVTAPAELVDTVIGIWSGVLGLEPGEIAPGDDFFSLGGHSLAAVQVAMELQTAMGVEVSISDVFHHLTPAELAGMLATPADAGPAPLPRTPGQDHPLSYAQESLWILQQLAPDSLAYSAPHAFHLKGGLDVPALEWALGQVVARHEPLRTTYAATRRGPVQRIAEPAPLRLPVVDTADPVRAVLEEYGRPFDLSKPPIRPVLFRVAPDDHVLLFLVHHIAFDGWSTAVFWRELCAFYRSRTTGDPVPPAPAVQYVDHVVWERERLSGERLRTLAAHWRERLDGADRTPFPADLPRPRRPLFQGAQHVFDLPVDVRALCEATGATAHMVHLAAFQIWQARRTGAWDLVTGSVVSGRTMPETAGLVGHFVNALPVRTDLTAAATFADAVAVVRHSLLDAYEHQELPLTLLSAELGLGRGKPFGLLFTLHDQRLLESADDVLRGVSMRRIEVPLGTAQFDLALEVTNLGDGARAVLEYDTALFLPRTVAAMADELRQLVIELVTGPDQPLRR